MFDVLSFAELDDQHAQLLPARTLMQAGGLGDILGILGPFLGGLGGK